MEATAGLVQQLKLVLIIDQPLVAQSLRVSPFSSQLVLPSFL